MSQVKKIKILMIAMQHSAKDDRIFYKESISLVKKGYDVICLILTNHDGFLKDMSGNILNLNNEDFIEIDGVKIFRILPPISKVEIFFKKILIGKFQKKMIQKIISFDADIYHAHEPISLRFALKTSKKTRKKVIFDSHESWVDGTLKERFIKLFYLKKVDYLITVNNGILQLFKNKHSFKKTETIYNASLPFFFNTEKIDKEVKNPIIVHEGSLLFNRGLKNMINSLILVKDKYPNIVLKIVGKSPIKEKIYLDKVIEKHDLKKNIIQTGWVEYENVHKELKGCDIGLILYNITSNNRFSTSNKLFNYIASGLAIVSVDLPETTKILEPLNNSICVKNHEPKEISRAIISLLKNSELLYSKKLASQKAYNKLSWQTEEKKLINFYDEVINN